MTIPVHGCDTTRRSLLKLSGLLGVSTMAAALLPPESAEALLFGRKQYKVSQTRLAMGTFVAMTAMHHSRDQVQEAMGQAFDEVSRLSRMLSRQQSLSPVAELNRTGVLHEVPKEVREVVSRSLFFHRETGGSFDITVKPLIDLYQSSFTAGSTPTEAQIAPVLALIGSSNIRIDGRAIKLAAEGMGITLDGIAKGYIVDRASEILAGYGIENHLINAGGDIRVSGSPAAGRKWRVAIQDPGTGAGYPDIFEMTAGAVATSGNYEVYYDREKMFHHIVNGVSGLSPHLSSSVSVLAPTVMEADALSTAVFVLEPQAGIALIDRQPGRACYVVRRDGTARASAGWPV